MPPAHPPTRLTLGAYALAEQGVLATRALGACMAVCLWDPDRGLAGLLHFVLPDSEGAAGPDSPALYADSGIDLLVSEMQGQGCRLSALRARLIGGASRGTETTPGIASLELGVRNLRAARRRLWTRCVALEAEDVGGCFPRSVHLRAADGRALVTSPGRADVIL